MMAESYNMEAYLNPELPVAERVHDLLSRMTLEEKLAQFSHVAAGVPRLGLPAYDFWSEGLHGVARNGRATVFPQAIGMSATWDPVLIRAIASAIAEEARAKYHETLRNKTVTGQNQGLTIWSPNINIFRDPRWGRGQETWGEDPFLTGEMGTAFVLGLQGDDPKYLKTAACAKHFAVHSGPEKIRHSFNARVSRRDLFSTYLPAFKKLVTEAKVESVMGAYNRTLDEVCCGSQLLLVDILPAHSGTAAFRTVILPSGSRRGGRSVATTFSPDLQLMRESMPAAPASPLSYEGQAPQAPRRELWQCVAMVHRTDLFQTVGRCQRTHLPTGFPIQAA